MPSTSISLIWIRPDVRAAVEYFRHAVRSRIRDFVQGDSVMKQ
jgi:hypothetical protein